MKSKKALNNKISPWLIDKGRYPKRPWLKEQSIWAIAIYRWGSWNDKRNAGFSRWIFTKMYWPIFRIFETLIGISIPKSVKIGPGLKIWHFGNIFIHQDVIIGDNCTLRHGVTIGNREANGPVPIIGNNVDFGAYAQVLGGVVIGNNVRIGAMSVVLKDVPTGATVVGNPARMIIKKKSENNELD